MVSELNQGKKRMMELIEQSTAAYQNVIIQFDFKGDYD